MPPMEAQIRSSNVNAKHLGAFVVLVCVLTFVGIVARALDENRPGRLSASMLRESLMQRPTVLVNVTSPTLSKMKAAAALSDYLGQVQLILEHLFMLHDIYMSNLQQEIQRKNQDQFRNNAESMRTASEKARDALFAIPIPEDLSEQDTDQFEDVQNAALELAIMILTVDGVVHAHSDINRARDLTKQIDAVNRVRHDFESQVIRTLMYFGLSPKKINRQTYIVTPSDFACSRSLQV